MSEPTGSATSSLLLGGKGAEAEHKSILDRPPPSAEGRPALTSNQAQVDQLVTNFTNEATNWKSLAPMVVGGMVYRSTRLGLLSSSKNLPVFLQQIPGLVRIPSSVLALGAEAAAFEVSHRGIVTATAPGDAAHATEDLWRWNGKHGLKQGWLNSVVTFGTLKGGGKLAQEQNLILQHGFQDLSMVLGHGISYRMGLGDKPEGSFAEQMLHAEATNLQLGAGTALGHALTGGRLASMERGLDLAQEAGEKNFKDLSIFKRPEGVDPSLVFASGSPEILKAKPGSLEKDTKPEGMRSQALDPKDLEMRTEGSASGHESSPKAPGEEKAPPPSKEVQESKPPVSPPPIEPPQFARRLQLDDATLAAIEAYPAKVKKAAEGESNPVFFGLNIVKWWISLIKRDAGHWGADALVEGGKILFGRFQEKEEAQERVEKELKRVAQNARLTESWQAPEAKEMWRPLWDQTLNTPEGVEANGSIRLPLTRRARGGFLAAILQQVAKTSPEEANRWFQELAQRDVDLSVTVHEVMEGKEVEMPGGLQGEFQAEAFSLQETAEREDWKEVNRKLGELYLQALQFPEPSDRFIHLKVLDEIVKWGRNLSEVPVKVRRPLFASAVEQRILDLIHGIHESSPPSLNPHQQLAYQGLVSAALGMIYAQLGYERKSGERFKNSREKLQALQAERGNSAVEPYWKIRQILQDGSWEMSRQEAESMGIPEAEEKLQKGDLEGAFSHVVSQPQPLKRAYVLAHLVRLMREGVGEKVNPSLTLAHEEFSGQMVALAKKMGEEGQGLKMAWSNLGPVPARTWAYLGFALRVLGETGLAQAYFEEAIKATHDRVMANNPDYGMELGRARAKAEGLKQGIWEETDISPWVQALVNQVKDLGSMEAVLEFLPQAPTLLEKAQLVAHLAKLLKETVPQVQEDSEALVPSVWKKAFEKHLPNLEIDPTKAQPGFNLVDYGLLMAVQAYLSEGVGDSARAQEFWDQYDEFMVSMGRNHPDWGRLENRPAVVAAKKMREGTWELDPQMRTGAIANAEILVRQGKINVGLSLLTNLGKTEYGLGLAHCLDVLTKEMKAGNLGFPFPPGAVAILPGKTLTLGRAPDNDIVVPHSHVSGHHAKFQLTPDGFIILQDNNSSNGTYVDGLRLTPGQNHSLPASAVNIYLGPLSIKIDFPRPLPANHVALFVPENGGWVAKAHALPSAPKPVKSLSKVAKAALRREGVNHFDQLPRRDIATIPMEFRHLIPEPKKIVLFDRYKKMLNEIASMISAPTRIAPRLFGPPGVSKTTIPEMIANKMGVPLFRVPFSRRTDPKDMEGSWTIEEVNGELVPVFQGAAPMLALEHGFHLVLDEPDLARTGTLASINNVSAPGKYAWVRLPNGELKRIEVHKGARIYATENGVQEIGREEHGKDFLRRFVPYYVGPWTEKEVETVLSELYENHEGQRRWNRKTTQLLAHFHDIMRQLADGLVDTSTGQTLPELGNGVGQKVEFTPRSALRLAERLIASGPLNPESLSRAIRAEYILPLADPKDQQMVWDAQAKPIFAQLGIPVGPEYIPTPTMESISQKYLGGKEFPKNNFVWTDQALRVADEMLWNQSLGIDVFLIGEAGEGKTELPPQIAALLDVAYLQKTASSQMDEKDLVGGPGRKNGKYGHVPDVVYIGTKDGGLIHIDEFLLAETGKLESVLNPLMDGTRALIMTKPYRIIKRHEKTFIVLTSNPPFGEYGDRYEHSGAAMSRVAVIFLTGDFAMQPADRQKILKAEMERPMEDEDEGEIKKKVTSSQPPPEGDTEAIEIDESSFLEEDPTPGPRGGERHLRVIEGGTSPGERHALRFSVKPEEGAEKPTSIPLPIHAEIQEKFGLPESLILDLEKIEIQEKKQDGSVTPLQAETQAALKKFADYLTRRTHIEMAPLVDKKVFKIFYALGGAHSTDLANREIRLNLEDLLTMPLMASLGVGKHEYAHAVIDRGSEKYDAHEPGRLYANYVGDPRMNEYASSLRPDFAEQIKTLMELAWPGELEPEQEKLWKENRLPHEQFADAIIYYWRFGKIMPRIEDPRVIDALNQALPLLKPAFTLFPQSTSDAHVDQAAKKFYQILDQAYPYYKELIDESMQEVMERLENGEKPEDLMAPPMMIEIRIPPPPEGPQAQGQGPQAQSQGPQGQGKGSQGLEDGAKTMVGLGVDPKAPAPSDSDKTPAPQSSNPQEGGAGDPSTPEGRLKMAKKIIDVRAGKLADAFEPKDPEAHSKRKKQIAMAQAKFQGEAPENAPSSSQSLSQSSSDLNRPLDENEMKKIEEERKRAMEKALENDLFRRMVPPQAIRAVKRLKKVLPPDDPTILDGHFDQGADFDMEHWVEDSLSPAPTGKAMLRYVRPGRREADVYLISDCSTSLVNAGARENAVRGSAAAIYLSEQLKMNYGEILFRRTHRIAKPLGKPLGTYQKKNELLNKKLQAFSDPTLPDGTNIREPLDVAIQAMKKRRAQSKYILLMTDGEEFSNYKKSWAQLLEEAKKEGIHIMVLAMGEAKRYIPAIFNNDASHYRFVTDNGSDIPEKTVELFEEAHKKRL